MTQTTFIAAAVCQGKVAGHVTIGDSDQFFVGIGAGQLDQSDVVVCLPVVAHKDRPALV